MARKEKTWESIILGRKYFQLIVDLGYSKEDSNHVHLLNDVSSDL